MLRNTFLGLENLNFQQSEIFYGAIVAFPPVALHPIVNYPQISTVTYLKIFFLILVSLLNIFCSFVEV